MPAVRRVMQRVFKGVDNNERPHVFEELRKSGASDAWCLELASAGTHMTTRKGSLVIH